MQLLSLPLLLVAFLAQQSAAQQRPALCIKGCCGLQLELPSQLLSFSKPTAQGSQAAISIHHPNTSIQCCECSDGGEGTRPVHVDDATTIADVPIDDNAYAGNTTKQPVMDLYDK